MWRGAPGIDDSHGSLESPRQTSQTRSFKEGHLSRSQPLPHHYSSTYGSRPLTYTSGNNTVLLGSTPEETTELERKSSMLGGDESAPQVVHLIPEDIPNSPTLWLLTTAEGRDKMFKVLQYVLMIAVWTIDVSDVLPLSIRFKEYWTKRLLRNIQTVRNGRAMFKLGRWIVTLFHITTIFYRLSEKYTPGTWNQMKLKSKELLHRIGLIKHLEEEPSIEFGDQTDPKPIEDELLVSRNKQFEDAESSLASKWKKSITDFSTPLMLLLLVRSVATVVRYMNRDVMQLFSKEMFGLTKSSVDRCAIQKRTNEAWFVVSLIDSLLNLYRLCDSNWYNNATSQDAYIKCECNASRPHGSMPIVRKKTDFFFPPLDLKYGAPNPTTPEFFEAAPPEKLGQCCAVCNKVCKYKPKKKPTKRYVVLLLPWIIRKMYSVSWCMSNHSNLFHTLLLQIRYFCDLYLATGYAFRDFDPCNTSMSPHRHIVGSLCGLTSALIALMRVYKSTT